MDKQAPFPIYQLMECWAAHAYGTPEVRAHHHALYYALLNLVKTKGGLTRFSLAYGHGMECSGIGSKATYLATLRELQGWGFLTYTPGENRFVLPIIEVTIQPSTGPLLALYRTSIATSTDTSTGRNKEVSRLEVECKLARERIAELEAELADAHRALAGQKQTGSLPPVEPCHLTARTGGRQYAPPADDARLFTAADWPGLTEPKVFASICATLGYPQVDFELYRHQIAASLDGKELPAGSLRKWIESYLNGDRAKNKLLLPTPQVPNDIASNAVAGPVLGTTIPTKAEMLNPNWKPPHGQTTSASPTAAQRSAATG